MKTIGFTISGKENENRRALIPTDLLYIDNPDKIFIEQDYGNVLGYANSEYGTLGCNIVTRQKAFRQDIVCTLKEPQIDEQRYLESQTLFGWIHAEQNKTMQNFLIDHKMTAIAWENMYKNGLHCFWRNNELAGEVAIIQASLYIGKPIYECSVAVLGRGNTAKGAIKILNKLGAFVNIYDRKTINNLRNELQHYDIIVNCILWDITRTDRLIYREDLRRMKQGAMIIDVTCNNGLEIETTKPMPVENPVYKIDGILHYTADHTPTIYYKTASQFISSVIKDYINDLIEGNENEVLRKATLKID